MTAAQGSAARERPSLEDAIWRGHSHGSERRCDAECWSQPVPRPLPPTLAETRVPDRPEES